MADVFGDLKEGNKILYDKQATCSQLFTPQKIRDGFKKCGRIEKIIGDVYIN